MPILNLTLRERVPRGELITIISQLAHEKPRQDAVVTELALDWLLRLFYLLHLLHLRYAKVKIQHHKKNFKM